MKQEGKLCNDVATVSEIKYQNVWVSIGGGCQAVVTATTRCGWVKFKECGQLLCGKRFPLRLKGDISTTCVWLEILCGI